MQFKKGDRIIYTAIGGMEYPGEVTSVTNEGFVNLAVDLGARYPWPLTAIRVEKVRLAS